MTLLPDGPAQARQPSPASSHYRLCCCIPLQTTLSSAAVFGLFLGAGSLLHCGRNQGY